MKSPTAIIVFSGAMLLFSVAAAQAQVRSGKQNSPAAVEATFKSLDSNRDRALSRIEAKKDASIWAVFDLADVNLDGYISKPEYMAYLERSAAPATSREQPAQ